MSDSAQLMPTFKWGANLTSQSFLAAVKVAAKVLDYGYFSSCNEHI